MNDLIDRSRLLPDSGSDRHGAQAAPVYERLGTIVRALHDTLRELGAEGVLVDAASEFPSARDRLLHIASLTENAANVVLTKVEEHRPAQERLAREAGELLAAWDCDGDVLQESAACSLPLARTRAFLAAVKDDCGGARAALSEIMLAQDFQDLTGQLIKKVVALMERTENDLLRLLIDAAPPGTAVHVGKEDLTAGPGAHGGIALDQASVDDLLADLGF
jgi:chemotaxis protein CheZ